MDPNIMFFITGLPRSRSAWFAEFMTDDNVYCYHELLNKIKVKEDFKKMMLVDHQHVGNSDCGLFMTDHQEIFPDAKTVIIHRNINDVYHSLKEKGLEMPIKLLKDIESLNCNIEGLHVDFDDINEQLEDIYFYCTNQYINKDRVKEYINKDIQVNISGKPESVLIWSK